MFHGKGYNRTPEKATIRKRFTDFEYCIAKNDIDIENDTFKFFASGDNAVCITSLHVDGKQIFVGKNDDLGSFKLTVPSNRWPSICSEDNMSTSSLTIKNGEVIQSQCKGKNSLRHSNYSLEMGN